MTEESKADLEQILRLHQPVQGESKADRRRYCRVCAKEWVCVTYPCGTVRLIRQIMEREGVTRVTEEGGP